MLPSLARDEPSGRRLSVRAGALTGRRNDRALGLGLVVGAAGLAVASRYLARRAHRAAGEGLVDWPRVEQIAVARLRRAPGALSAAEMRSAEMDYGRAMVQVVPLLERHLGRPLPGVVERHAVVDRAGWARANIATLPRSSSTSSSLTSSLARPARPRHGRGAAWPTGS